jgi:hypothetical protein
MVPPRVCVCVRVSRLHSRRRTLWRLHPHAERRLHCLPGHLHDANGLERQLTWRYREDGNCEPRQSHRDRAEGVMPRRFSHDACIFGFGTFSYSCPLILSFLMRQFMKRRVPPSGINREPVVNVIEGPPVEVPAPRSVSTSSRAAAAAAPHTNGVATAAGAAGPSTSHAAHHVDPAHSQPLRRTCTISPPPPVCCCRRRA